MTQNNDIIELATGFPTASREDWLRLVDKVLKGSDFDKRLVSRTEDGLRVQPLYTGRDAAPAARPMRDSSGWDIRQLHIETDARAANTAILADLEGGVTSLTLQLEAPGQIGLPPVATSLGDALAGVDLSICPVALQAGDIFPDGAGFLLALWRERGIEEAMRRGAFQADPLGTLAATGALYHPLDRALSIAAGLLGETLASPGVTALIADGRPYHAGGATEAQELAAMLATLVAYLRAAENAGHAPERAFAKISLGLAADTDQFLTIAKLRAARLLVARVAEAAGLPAPSRTAHITATTSWRMLTKRDPWVNMLRTTIATAAAAMGGADAITALPFTAALGKSDVFARRIARNTQIVLQEESSLGRVSDPAAGAWYVEDLTRQLAGKAWSLFQDIEAKGGMAVALTSGMMQDWIAAARSERAKAIAVGKRPLTGSSAFPFLSGDGVKAEPWPTTLATKRNGTSVTPLTIERLAEPFEALRDKADANAEQTGKPLQVFMANLGTLAEFGTRANWVRNYLAAGGIETVGSSGFTASADAGKAFAASGCHAACICGTDETYALLAEATASLLKTAGARTVLLAGRPNEQQGALEMAGVDVFVFAGSDAVATLTDLYHRMSGAAAV